MRSKRDMDGMSMSRKIRVGSVGEKALQSVLDKDKGG